MSVATQHSPFAVGSKRLYESEENEDHLQRLDSSAASHKRYRQRGSPSARCGGDSAAQHAYTVGHTTVTALRGLFPEMSDKVRHAAKAVRLRLGLCPAAALLSEPACLAPQPSLSTTPKRLCRSSPTSWPSTATT